MYNNEPDFVGLRGDTAYGGDGGDADYADYGVDAYGVDAYASDDSDASDSNLNYKDVYGGEPYKRADKFTARLAVQSHKDAKESDAKPPKDAKIPKDAKPPKDAKDAKGAKPPKDDKPPKESEDSSDDDFEINTMLAELDKLSNPIGEMDESASESATFSFHSDADKGAADKGAADKGAADEKINFFTKSIIDMPRSESIVNYIKQVDESTELDENMRY